MYVLNITIPPRDVDNCLEPAKAVVQLQVSVHSSDVPLVLNAQHPCRVQNSEAVSALLAAVVTEFLVRNGFKSVVTRTHTPPPRKRRRLEDLRQKSASLPVLPSSSNWVDHETPTLFLGRQQRSGTSTPIIIPDVRWASLRGTEYSSISKDTLEDQEILTWTDPQTGEKCFVDPRTGN